MDSTSDIITDDERVDYLISEAPGATNLVISVTVISDLLNLATDDPCPSVQWTFNGANIQNNSDYTVSDPCSDGSSRSPYIFTLTIANLTTETSGEYSAVFTVLTTSVTLSTIVVTVPSK